MKSNTDLKSAPSADLGIWRLSEELSVVDAALLAIEENPSRSRQLVDDPQRCPAEYDAIFSALKNAILSKKLPAKIRRVAWERGYDEKPAADEAYTRDVALADDADPFAKAIVTTLRTAGVIYHVNPNWCLTTVTVDDVRVWLKGRGISSGFFFQPTSGGPDYLNPDHNRYSSKLAAAVRAWQAVTNPGPRHPKQALLKWLRDHAQELGLCDKKGEPNENGIEEVSKVANWRPGGGAPKTGVIPPNP